MGEDMRTFWAVVPATHVSRLPGLKRDSIQINMGDVNVRFQLVSAGKQGEAVVPVTIVHF